MAAQAKVNASTEAEITETFWPRLWEILSDDPSGMDRLNLKCMVCHERMTTDEDEEDVDGQEDQPLRRGAHILPCGHMACEGCVRNVLNHACKNASPYCCPFCRMSLDHGECEHPHPGVPMQQAVRSLHLTPPEGRRVLPRLCDTCGVLSVYNGLNSILVGMGEDEEFHLAENEYIALSVRGGYSLWAVQDHADGKVRDVEMPEWLLEDCQRYAERLISRSRSLWRTFELQELTFGLHVYQELPGPRFTDRGQLLYSYLKPGGHWMGWGAA
ncbi:hypothetical protein ACJZ2D_010216 [Fusarium nematophilum]